MCGLLEGPLRDQWELHHTVKVTDTPATYSFGHVVVLAALDMVQPWAELDVAGVGLSFANWMAVVTAPYIVFVLMLNLLHFVFRSRVACLWIGPRLALAAMWVNLLSLSHKEFYNGVPYSRTLRLCHANRSAANQHMYMSSAHRQVRDTVRVLLFQPNFSSSSTPAPYEKAQEYDVICKRAAHPGNGLSQKKCLPTSAPMCLCTSSSWSRCQQAPSVMYGI